MRIGKREPNCNELRDYRQVRTNMGTAKSMRINKSQPKARIAMHCRSGSSAGVQSRAGDLDIRVGGEGFRGVENRAITRAATNVAICQQRTSQTSEQGTSKLKQSNGVRDPRPQKPSRECTLFLFARQQAEASRNRDMRQITRRTESVLHLLHGDAVLALALGASHGRINRHHHA